MEKNTKLEYTIHEITDRIRELRTILGITEEEMAERLGMRTDDYQAYEAGEEELNFAFLYTCAQILNVDVTELIEGVTPRLSSYILTRSGRLQVPPPHCRAPFFLLLLQRDRAAPAHRGHDA